MADANDIAQNAAYVGNANLSGGNFGVITVDPKPLQDLAYYSMMAVKYKHEENKKATDDKIKELADISDISLNSLRDKDKIQATEEFTKLLNFYREQAYITPKTSEGKVRQQLELQTKKRDFMDNYNSGKTRALSYLKQETDVNNDVTLNAKQKEAKVSRLNELFDKTGIGVPLSAVENFKIDNIELPKNQKSVFDSVAIGGNEDIVSTISIDVPANNVGAANATIMGLASSPKKDSPEYAKLSATEKLQADLSNSNASTAQVWATMADPLNESLPKYMDNGIFRRDDFVKDFAANPTILNPFLALEAMSKKNEGRKQEAKVGVYSDNNVQFKLPVNIKPTDFDAGIVDFSKPITPVQLVLSGMSAKAEPDKVEKKVIQTDNAIQQSEIAAANYRARLNVPKEPVTVDPNTFGNLLYGVNIENKFLKNVFPDVAGIKNGSVVDKDGKVLSDKTGDMIIPASGFNNSIITEYNKYAAGKSVNQDKDGVITTTETNGGGSILKPNTNGELKVRFENGVIKGIYAADGTLIDDNLFQDITIKSAQKGTTKYKQPNTDFGKFNTPQGKSTTTSKSYSIKGKSYTIEDLKGLGYTDEQINQAIKNGTIK